MSGTSSRKGPQKGTRKHIRLVKRVPSTITSPPIATPNPIPITPTTNHSSIPGSLDSPFSSPIVQTPVFSSNETPRPNGSDPGNHSSSQHPNDISNNTHSSTHSDLNIPSSELNLVRRGKTEIWPEERGLFCAQHHPKIVRKITDIYRGKFEGAYPSWGKVPRGVRNMWFDEFKKFYWWEDHDEKAVRERFEYRGRESLKDAFREVRNTPDTCPDWLEKAVWESLREYWNSDAFKNKSNAGVLNRASKEGVGSSVHCGGSIPVNVHKKNMIDKGEDPTVSRVYLRLHQTKGHEWVEDKCREAHENYMKKLDETLASQLNEVLAEGSDQPTPPQLTYDEQMKIWIDANGVTDRGHVCGFGPQGDSYQNTASKSAQKNKGKDDTNTIASLVEENLKQKRALENTQSKLEEESKKRKKFAQATQTNLANLLVQLKTLNPTIAFPNLVLDSISEGEDEEDDVGSHE